MRPAKDEWYIGIDLGRTWTLVSSYQSQQKEPKTHSTVAGGEQYRIPTAICKKRGLRQWHIGEEAGRIAQKEQGIYVDNLLVRALRQELIEAEETYEAKELLYVFLRRVMRLAMPKGGMHEVTECVVTVEELSAPLVLLLEEALQKAGLRKDQQMICDYRESFYAYAVSQPIELWRQKAMLFDYREDGICLMTLEHDRNTSPGVCRVSRQNLGILPEEPAGRDEEFCRLAEQVIGDQFISSVYLAGDGFDGDWMERSLHVVCRGRRAFQGKNLHTRGACYLGMHRKHQKEAETVYFCEYKVGRNIFLKGKDKGQEIRWMLAAAEDNLYQSEGGCRVLLEGNVLTLWQRHPTEHTEESMTFPLSGLSCNKQEPCRLLIELSGSFDGKMTLCVSETGLGEVKPGEGLTWQFQLTEQAYDSQGQRTEGREELREDRKNLEDSRENLWLCSQQDAACGFFIEEEKLWLYSLEELYYYVSHHAENLSETMFKEDLFAWIEQELGEKTLARKLRAGFAAEKSSFWYVGTILAESGYFDSDRLEEIRRTAEKADRKSPMERAKMRADRMLKSRRYKTAILEYNRILRESEDKAGAAGAAEILHNIGTAYAGQMLFERAAEYYKRAYEKGGFEESRVQYLTACSYAEGNLPGIPEEKEMQRLVKLRQSGDRSGYDQVIRDQLEKLVLEYRKSE